MMTMAACPPAPAPLTSMVVATAMAMAITTMSTTSAPAYYPGTINSHKDRCNTCTCTYMAYQGIAPTSALAPLARWTMGVAPAPAFI